MTLVQARGLTAGYGGVPVIHEMDLAVAPGEIVALLGPNGAGKTTTLLALTNEIPRLGGEISYDGTASSARLHQLASRGLAYVTEERSVFMELTTHENLRVGRCDADRVLELFPELKARLGVRAGSLSGGEQQMLTLGRALARRPRLLLADELSLGLAPLIVTRLLETVRAAATEQQTGVLIVEQHVRKVLRYADRVCVVQRGRIVFEASAAEARERIDEIERSYLSSEPVE